MKDYEDKAFDDLERAQGWRKRQIADKQEGHSNFCANCEALARELKAIKQEQGEPVAVHRESGMTADELWLSNGKLRAELADLRHSKPNQEQEVPEGYKLVMVPNESPTDEPDWDECIRQAEVSTGLKVERNTLSIVIREVRRWLIAKQEQSAQHVGEPVAWRWKVGDSSWQLEDKKPRSPTVQPLYTHAQPKRDPLTEWLPIETAPKDGRNLILLLTPSKFPQVAYSNSWWTSGFSVENKPTHWMPIPPIEAAHGIKE